MEEEKERKEKIRAPVQFLKGLHGAAFIPSVVRPNSLSKEAECSKKKRHENTGKKVNE